MSCSFSISHSPGVGVSWTLGDGCAEGLGLSAHQVERPAPESAKPVFCRCCGRPTRGPTCGGCLEIGGFAREVVGPARRIFAHLFLGRFLPKLAGGALRLAGLFHGGDRAVTMSKAPSIAGHNGAQIWLEIIAERCRIFAEVVA